MLKTEQASISIVNEAFTGFLSISREEIIGKTVYDIWATEEADVFFAQDNALFEQGGLQVYETQITSPAGKKHIVEFQKQVFIDSDGVIAGFLGAIFDITDMKRLENTLAQLATLDELTGLPNRRDGIARLDILYKDSERKKRPFCIAMVDIDHFKRINDQYGHSVGDIVLKYFADFLKNSLRCSDICFRYGGEEFVILLPETKLYVGLTVVERLRQAWEHVELALEGDLVHSTISIGLTQYTQASKTFEELLEESDKALYRAKDNGRNCTVSS